MRHERSGMRLAKFFIPLAVAIGFAAALVCAASALQNSSDHKVLFEKAKFTMETKGDLKGAIELFEEIIKKYPNERDYAARSLYLMGMCYEKLGERQAQQAQAVFQRIVEDYPDQTDAVNMAKERLANLTRVLVEEKHKPSFRKIRIPANPGNGVLSPDGKLLAFTSQDSVWIVPISGKVQPDLAGEPVRLTEPMGAWNMGNIMAWSGDGQWIAFNGEDNKKDAIYVVSPSGGKPKKIPVDRYGGNHVYNYRLSLSADGEILAFCSKDFASSETKPEKSEPASSLRLYAIPVNGGEARRLTDTWAGGPAFSLDGKKIAFTRAYFFENEKMQNDIWAMNSDGTKPIKVTEFPGRARGPVWSPDGKMIAFHYEPGDSNFSDEIWIVPAPGDRKLPGAPIKIKLPSESLSMIAGWTTDNKMGLLLTNPLHQAVYTVPAGGGKATQVSPETATQYTGSEDFEGYPCYPRWSPEGKTIYFRWGKGHIVAVPSQGGNLSPVHSSKGTQLIEVLPGGGNDVSPDGKKSIFSAYKETRPLEVNIWTVPSEGGKPTQITKGPNGDRYPCWSPDGKRIAFIRATEKSKDEYVMNIYIVPGEGGEILQLTKEADRVNYASIRWAPDGNHIAYFSRDQTINVKPLEGGEPRVVVNVENVHSHCDLSWSPDGKELAYTSKGRIMVVPLGGGEPREIKTGILNEEVQNFHIDWSPDGKKFAFTAGFGGDEELWLMESFLPEDKKK